MSWIYIYIYIVIDWSFLFLFSDFPFLLIVCFLFSLSLGMAMLLLLPFSFCLWRFPLLYAHFIFMCFILFICCIGDCCAKGFSSAICNMMQVILGKYNEFTPWLLIYWFHHSIYRYLIFIYILWYFPPLVSNFWFSTFICSITFYFRLMRIWATGGRETRCGP